METLLPRTDNEGFDPSLLAGDQKDRELEARFDPDQLAELCEDFFENGVEGVNLREHINGRNFVVAYIDAESPYGDIGRSVEYTVFSKAFKEPLHQVDAEYGRYDAASKFACVIDVSGDKPIPAGVLRITEYQEGLGFKDLNDLVEDSSDNPWLDEIKEKYFVPGEEYDPDIAWQRLGKQVGVELKPEDTLDIATHAAAEAYRNRNGSIDSTSMLFFHACLRYALAAKKDNLIAIFDLKPFDNVQQFGGPFDEYEDLSDQPYGGPGLTRPAFCKIERALERIGATDVAGVFIKGEFLDTIALMPNEYLPDTYSNAAVGLE